MKKNILLTLACIFMISISYSQITKGSLLLGGNISFGFNKSEANSVPDYFSKSKGITASPSVGIAVRQNTVVGVGLFFQRNDSHTNPPTSTNKSTGYGGSLFLRKYLSLGKSFYLFAETSAYFNKSKDESRNTTNNFINSKVTSTGLRLYPGIAYAVNKRFHLEVGINDLINLNYSYRTSSSSASPNNDQSNKSFNFSSSASAAAPLSVGFRFLFAK